MIKYKVVLSADEQSELELITSQGKHSARKIKRAQILLMSHSQLYTDENIVELLLISQSTIHRTRRYFVEYDLSDALHDAPRSGQPHKLDGNQEALLISITWRFYDGL